MDTALFTDCQICAVKSTSKYCSQPCEIGKENLVSLQKELTELKQSEDRRVFFFDHSMSELCDMYTIAMLKYAHEKNMKRQQVFVKTAEKLLKSIITKINRRHITKELLQAYVNLIRDLYKANANMWYCRKMALAARFNPSDRSEWAMNYLEADDLRTALKIEIDTYADGISFAEKNYE